MTVGSGEVRADDQQLGAFDFARTELLAQLVDEVLRRVKILDRRDTVGENALLEDLRHLFVEERVAFLLVAAVEAALNMNVAVDKSRHQGFACAVDNLHVFLFNRDIRDFLDLTALDIDVLMRSLVAVADDDMNVLDDILALFVFLRTFEKLDCQKDNDRGSENHLNKSDKRNTKYTGHDPYTPLLPVKNFSEEVRELSFGRNRHSLLFVSQNNQSISGVDVKHLSCFLWQNNLPFGADRYGPCVLSFGSIHQIVLSEKLYKSYLSY